MSASCAVPALIAGEQHYAAHATPTMTSRLRTHYGLEHVPPAQERLQRLGYGDRTVRTLMVLQNGDDPSCGGRGTVQCGRDLGLAVVVAVPHAEPPSLERGAVRCRGQLAVAPLRRDPRLAVVLARGR